MKTLKGVNLLKKRKVAKIKRKNGEKKALKIIFSILLFNIFTTLESDIIS